MELIFAISALLVPIALAMVAVVNIATGALLAETVARETARTFVLADDDEAAFVQATLVARLAFADAGHDFVAPTLTCSARPCLSAGGSVRVAVRIPVDVPWGRWTVRSAHVQVVDPWRAWE